MSIVTRTALKWGMIIGLANLVWLYLAYYLGLHTNGIMVFQVFVLIWFVITLTGFILMLRTARGLAVEWNYWVGLRAGVCAAIVTAVVAVLMQAGYYTVVHPAWPEVMVQQTREHFAAKGLSQEVVERMADQARQTFTLKNYAVQSAITALLAGIVLSAIIMILLRGKPPTSTSPEVLRNR